MTDALGRPSSAASPLLTQHFVASKVPAVTLLFWIIKIAATTLGETGGDTLSMTLNLGYLTSTAIFLVVLVAFVALQIGAKRFHPFLYWATIIASTTAGTTLADFADRSLGIGYAGGSLLLLVCVMAALATWYRTEGSVAVSTVEYAARRGFLLDHHHLLADARHRAGRLDGRLWPRLPGRCAAVRRGAGRDRRRLLLDTPVARTAVLGGIHHDAAAGRDGRRLLRQTAEPGWPQRQPPIGFGHPRRFHPCLPAGSFRSAPAAIRVGSENAVQQVCIGGRPTYCSSACAAPSQTTAR